MAFSTLEIGPVTSTKTFSKTNAQVDMLLWFIANWSEQEPPGLTCQETNGGLSRRMQRCWTM